MPIGGIRGEKPETPLSSVIAGVVAGGNCYAEYSRVFVYCIVLCLRNNALIDGIHCSANTLYSGSKLL